MLHCVTRNSQTGIALVAVLIFMQILAILSWCAMESVLLEIKMTQNFVQHRRVFAAAEQALLMVEKNFSADDCVDGKTTKELLAQPLSWWQAQKNCANNLHNFQCNYVVELLANDFCAKIDREKSVTASYFRITLLLAKKEGAKFFLQSTIVQPSRVIGQCHGVSRWVTAGRQSWRIIS